MLRPPAVGFVYLFLELSHTLLVDGDGGADTTVKDSPVEVDLVISGTLNSHLWRPKVLLVFRFFLIPTIGGCWNLSCRKVLPFVKHQTQGPKRASSTGSAQKDCSRNRLKVSPQRVL